MPPSLVLAAVTIAPLLWLFIMSISSAKDMTVAAAALDSRPGRFLPLCEAAVGGRAFGRRGIRLCAAQQPGRRLGASAIALLAGIPAAYSFSRYPGRMGLLYTVLGTYMMPPVALILPLYMVFSALGLLNSVTALVIVYCTILLPFVTWLLKSNFDTVPIEIEQAARIDGASLFGVIRHVTLPIAKAGVGTAALFAVLLAWDEFFYALLYTNDLRAKTLPVAIADFAAGRATDYALISAAGILTALPPLLIAFFLQKSLISGLAAGGVKG